MKLAAIEYSRYCSISTKMGILALHLLKFSLLFVEITDSGVLIAPRRLQSSVVKNWFCNLEVQFIFKVEANKLGKYSLRQNCPTSGQQETTCHVSCRPPGSPHCMHSLGSSVSSAVTRMQLLSSRVGCLDFLLMHVQHLPDA